MLVTLKKIDEVYFSKDLLLRARVVVRTKILKILFRHLADYVNKLDLKACRTCSTIIFPQSTNQIIKLWCCRCRCGRRFLNSLLPEEAGSKPRHSNEF